MALTVAVQMDPIAKIKIAGDSTFALLLEAERRGHRLLHYGPERLSMRDGRVVAAVEALSVRDEEGNHATLGQPTRTDLSEADVVLMRQDPPFDIAYITATHLLERLGPRTLVVNDPISVRNAPEKLFVTQFPDLMPPTLITRDKRRSRRSAGVRRDRGEAAARPWRRGVIRLVPDDPNFGSVFDLFSVTFKEPWVVQRFSEDHGRRQAHRAGRGRAARRREPRSGRQRPPLEHGAGRGRERDRTDRARARDLRDDRPELKARGLSSSAST
jgi:glutathione synthase